ncbi:MAG: DUF192 domain-containing protein [Endomicrobiales bacterium]
MRKRFLLVNGCPSDVEVAIAAAFLSRLLGLMGRRTPQALFLSPCSGIHTFFMRFPIDAVFLDRAGRIVTVLPGLRPWRAALPALRARSVLELPAGAARRLSLKAGDILTFSVSA